MLDHAKTRWDFWQQSGVGYRRIRAGITRLQKIRNDGIRQALGSQTTLLKLFNEDSSCLDMKNDRWPNSTQWTTCAIGMKRNRGRPRLPWIDNYEWGEYITWTDNKGRNQAWQVTRTMVVIYSYQSSVKWHEMMVMMMMMMMMMMMGHNLRKHMIVGLWSEQKGSNRFTLRHSMKLFLASQA